MFVKRDSKESLAAASLQATVYDPEAGGTRTCAACRGSVGEAGEVISSHEDPHRDH